MRDRGGHDVVVDQQRRVGVHEVDVARVAGRHHRLAQVHGLGHGQAIALGTVQRHVGVERCHQVERAGRVQRLLDEEHVAALRALAQVRAGWHVALRGVDLQHQSDVATRAEGRPEGVDQPGGVLALGDAVDVEEEAQEQHVFGKAEARAVGARGVQPREVQGRRQALDRHRDRPGHGVGGVPAGRDDQVHAQRRIAEPQRQLLGFPHPAGDVDAPGHVRAGVPLLQVVAGIGIGDEQVDAMAGIESAEQGLRPRPRHRARAGTPGRQDRHAPRQAGGIDDPQQRPAPLPHAAGIPKRPRHVEPGRDRFPDGVQQRPGEARPVHVRRREPVTVQHVVGAGFGGHRRGAHAGEEPGQRAFAFDEGMQLRDRGEPFPA